MLRAEQIDGASPVASIRPTTTVWRQQVVHFILKRRVFISAVLFCSLVLKAIVTGVVPHDVLNFKDVASVSGLLCVFLGLAVRSWSAGFLIKDEKLTTDGPYALIRNPLYFGSFLLALGFSLLIGDRENLVILAIALPIIYYPKVLSEERMLAGRFPAAWIEYAATTPRLIPRRLCWPSLAGWQKSQWLLSREYNALLTSCVAVVALQVLHQLRG
jgi:protein-S-isoprenylcysteine O-methyltransferase Ste14